jgi:hypothetical protein
VSVVIFRAVLLATTGYLGSLHQTEKVVQIGRLLATREASEILLVKFDCRSKLYAFGKKIDK